MTSSSPALSSSSSFFITSSTFLSILTAAAIRDRSRGCDATAIERSLRSGRGGRKKRRKEKRTKVFLFFFSAEKRKTVDCRDSILFASLDLGLKQKNVSLFQHSHARACSFRKETRARLTAQTQKPEKKGRKRVYLSLSLSLFAASDFSTEKRVRRSGPSLGALRQRTSRSAREAGVLSQDRSRTTFRRRGNPPGGRSAAEASICRSRSHPRSGVSSDPAHKRRDGWCGGRTMRASVPFRFFFVFLLTAAAPPHTTTATTYSFTSSRPPWPAPQQQPPTAATPSPLLCRASSRARPF